MRTIYCLELENDRFFLFSRTIPSSNPVELFLEAVLSFEYVRQHKPIAIKDVWPETEPLELDHRVKQHMLIYGIDYVRGGSYSNPELTLHQDTLLTTELQGPTVPLPTEVIKEVIANCAQLSNGDRKKEYARLLEERARYQAECAVLADLRRLDIPKARADLDWLLAYCESAEVPLGSLPLRLDTFIKTPIITRYHRILRTLPTIYSFMTLWGRPLNTWNDLPIQYPRFLLDDFFYEAWNSITTKKVEHVRQLCEAYQTFVTTWENRLAEAEFDVASWEPYTEARFSCALTLLDLVR